MRLLLKNTFKKINNSIGRFLSIMFIIALGISIFIGLRESTAGMLYTADNYFDENNLMDFKVISTYGLNNDDVKSLEKLTNADKVISTYSVDVISNGASIRIHAIESDVNNVILVEGEMPKNKGECVADYSKYKIGDTVSFETNNDADILLIKKCKVVGIIKSALYVRDEKGISTVGNGKLSSFIFVKKEVFESEYYTEVYLTSKYSKSKRSYYDDYTETIKPLENELKELKPIRETIRYEEILKEANDEITKVKNELNEKIKDANKKLSDSKTKLDNGKKELESTKKSTIQKLDSSKQSLLEGKKEILSALASLGISENELDGNISSLLSAINNLKDQLSYLSKDSEEYKAVSMQIAELEKSYQQLNTIKNNLNEINNNLVIIENNYKEFQSEITKKEAELQNGYNEYYKGLSELKENEEEANKKIEDAKAKLKTIEKPVWYLLDRSDNSGYISYKEDVIKVDAVAKILPLFFIVIAVLMILNTLTRLIEEERTEIGILQSNGFSKTSIIFSYLTYVCTAGFLGIGIGLTVGYGLIPPIIYSAFLYRYYVPKLITIVSPLPFTLVIEITLSIIILITVAACRKELKESPASLLRSKPPKSGKKVLFERIGFIWKNLSFFWKTTIRNIFRYKKRIIMTILGVAGCTSLLVTGMGLNDSIDNISKLQYKDIVKYDAMYILKNNVTEMPDDLSKLYNDSEIVNPLLISQNVYTFSFDNKTEDVYVVVPSDTNAFSNYVNIKNIINNENVSINDNGAIISKQFANHLNVEVGDSVAIRNSDNELFYLYVTDIVENYVSHYIYISKNYYKQVFNNDISYNTILANGKVDNSIRLTDYDVLMVNYTIDIINQFNSFVNGLNKIIIMIIIFACFLAFVVLYNLTIINVSERKREIATFKVLGFYNKEIASFIYRETIILTILGIAFGLFLGKYLHSFVMSTAETDNILFLRQIDTISFVLSALITIIFSIIVQLIINRTLKKIDMIDSLKSVE